MFEQYRLYDNVICIDFKSYYATVECIKRNLDPETAKLCVANPHGGPSAIALALSPGLKKCGFGGRPRLREMLDEPDLIVVTPHMQDYIDMSITILKIYLEFVAREDIFVYSIDEVFIDLTKYLKLYQLTAYELAKKIMHTVYERTSVLSTCGIGPNMLMAKFALDIESKHTPEMIAEWTYADLPKKLWPILDMTDVWSIGKRKQIRLNKCGYLTIGDIANGDVKQLINEFGILGEEMYLHANGIDISKIQDTVTRIRKSVGRGHTLTESYHNENVLSILWELNYEVTLELQKIEKLASTLTIAWSYDYNLHKKSFAKTIKINPTNKIARTNEYIKELFNKYYIPNTGVRKISISFSGLSDENMQQLDLFSTQKEREENADLEKTLFAIRQKHGPEAANTSVSHKVGAISKKRKDLIGGHHA